ILKIFERNRCMKHILPPSLSTYSFCCGHYCVKVCFLETGHQIADQVFEIVLAPHRLPEGELGIEPLSPLAGQVILQTPDQCVKLGLAKRKPEGCGNGDDLVLALDFQAVKQVRAHCHRAQEVDYVSVAHSSPYLCVSRNDRNSSSVCRLTT